MLGEQQHEVILLEAFVVLAALWIVAQVVLLLLRAKRWTGYFVTAIYCTLGMAIVVVFVWPSDWSDGNQLFRFVSILVAFGICGVCLGPLYLRSYRRHYRANMGLCLLCGYDLRASKGRCPECGAPIPGKAQEKA